ncbi:hypothetical protein BJX62DRAFT_236233 [Aspergillus germanicus]
MLAQEKDINTWISARAMPWSKTISLLCLGTPALGAIWFTAPETVPWGSAPVLPPSFVSYSIELAYLPDYAVNKSHPNTFSENLLEQLRRLSGGDARPTIRVGGSSQDRVTYNPDLEDARELQGNGDIPSSFEIGPSFFESLNTFKDTRFIYGLNMKKSVQSADAYENMLDTVAVACRALVNDNFLAWSYGNEPNLYGFDWVSEEYTALWLEASRGIRAVLEHECPELAEDGVFGFLTPSVSSLKSGHVNIPDILEAGINYDNAVFFLGAHNKIAETIQRHVDLLEKFAADYASIPYEISETNSLFKQGKAGVSNTFGAALWTLDFSLHAAARNISRLNFHMGRDYRYAAWQPVETDKTAIGTKVPYYGNLATAAILGNLGIDEVQVVGLKYDEDGGTESAYGIYHAGDLAKVVVLNMAEYNFTKSGNAMDEELNTKKRGSHNFSINVPESFNDRLATVRRLEAPGADSITGITWDGYTFIYEVDNGVGRRLENVTYGETIVVADAKVTVRIPHSSAVVLEV